MWGRKLNVEDTKELFLNMLWIRQSFKQDCSLSYARLYLTRCGYSPFSVLNDLIKDGWIKVSDGTIVMIQDLG